MDAFINYYEKLVCRVYGFGWWEVVEGWAKPKFRYCKQTVFAVGQYVLG